MSLLTTMLVVLAAMTAAPPAPALPDLPPVELPPLPELPADPPAVPPVTPAPTATPEPVATPGAPEPQTAAAAAPAPEPRPITTPSAPNAESLRRAPPRRPAPRAEARDDVDLASVRELDRRPEPRAADDEPSNSAPGIAGDVIELVEALPHAVLWALLGISGLALGLAGNAFWQSRQREKLEAQRAELLGDIGLLSSTLLPAVPDGLDGLDGLAVTAAYRPADGPAAGGDFYDVFPLDGGRLGVLLGDVSGHGRDSLAQAALARYTLRTLLAAGHAPGEALARADRMLHRELPPHFVTVIAAIYDPCGSLLTYAKAGHAPPIVLGAPYHPLAETPACPLGLALGDSWPEYSVRIDAGVTVCLYTDGLEDARVADGRVGREEVVRLLVAQPEPDAVRLLADLGDYADAICDDTAAVVRRRDQPPAGTAS